MKGRVLWLIPFSGLALGLCLGAVTAPKSVPRSGRSSAAAARFVGGAEASPGVQRAERQERASTSRIEPAAAARPPRESLAQAMSHPSNLHRTHALKTLFDATPPAMLPHTLGAIQSSGHEGAANAVAMLFRVWVEKDAREASRHALELPPGQERETVIAALARAWGRKDVDSARMWAQENMAGEALMRVMASLDAAAARRDAERPVGERLQAILSNPDDPQVRSKLTHVFSTWGTQDGATAVREAQELDPTYRADALSAALTSWARANASEAVRWLRTLDDQELRQLPLESLAFFVPEKELPELARLTLRSGNISAAFSSISRLTRSDHAAALQLVEEYRARRPEQVLDSFYRKWAEEEPAEAAEMLLRHHPLGDQNAGSVRSALDQMIRTWAEKKPAEAGAFIANLPASTHPSLFYALGEKWCQQDGAAALTWAAELPEGGAQNEAFRQLTYLWSKHDSSRTTAWLNQLPVGPAKSAAAEGFTFSIIDTDPDAALEWTRVIASQPLRLDVLKRAWRNWRNKNSGSAEDWLETCRDLTPAERAALTER